MRLTVFTPTFNRKNHLTNAYKALCRQTSYDFLWLIIDDGSSDGTTALVDSWCQERIINIDYHYQDNGGKMKAYNHAVSLTTTELFTCVDSDDYLVPTAVETILNLWDYLRKEKIFEHLSGIVAYCGETPTQTMQNEHFPPLRVSTLGNLYKRGFKGETALVYRSDILKQYPFPEIDGEKFIPEAVVYDKIDLKYQLYVLPEILTICKYQPEGLTKSIKQLRLKNPKGFFLYYQIKISITPPSILRYKYIVYAIRFAWYTHKNIFNEIPASALEVLCGVPTAFIFLIIKKL